MGDAGPQLNPRIGDTPSHDLDLDLGQAYMMVERPVDGAEIFSLVRTSDLDPGDYLDQFFDTGEERQQCL